MKTQYTFPVEVHSVKKLTEHLLLLVKGSYHPLLDDCSFLYSLSPYILLIKIIVGVVEKEEEGGGGESVCEILVKYLFLIIVNSVTTGDCFVMLIYSLGRLRSRKSTLVARA